MKSSLVLTLLFFIASCSTPPVQVGRDPADIKSCFSLISNFFEKKPSALENELSLLLNDIDFDELPKITSIHNRSDLFFYSIVSTHPKIIKLLEIYPQDKKEQAVWLKIVSGKIKGYHETSLVDYVEFINRKSLSESFNAKEFLSSQKITYEKLDANLKAELLQEVALKAADHEARTFFSRLLYVNLVHDNETVTIGNETFKYVISQNEIVITVPRSKVKSPAWNPLTKVQREKVLKNNPAPPAVYDATLGLDGNFYLLDGNHRFHLKETKDIIKVKIGGFKTSNLRSFLDLIGTQQLKVEEIKSIYNQEKSINEVLPEWVFKTIIWSEDDFIRN